MDECKFDLCNDPEYMIRDKGPWLCRLDATVLDEATEMWFCRRHIRPEFEEGRRAAASGRDVDGATGTKRL